MKKNIIQNILKYSPNLKVLYYSHLDDYTDSNIENASLGTQLHALSGSFSDAIISEKLDFEMIGNILKMIEEYLTERRDEDIEEIFEVMFFEGIINSFSSLDKSSENYKYVEFFRNRLGPISQKLCCQNDEFWSQVLISQKGG